MKIEITKAPNLLTNGFVKTSGSDGSLSIDTTSYQPALNGTGFVKISGTTISYDASTYLTSLSGAVLTSQASPQTIGATGSRLAMLWVTDITCSNAIAASITGNAATVSNLTLTTALTNNGGAGILAWPAAGATLTIPSGGGTLGTAAFTATGAYEASGAIATHAALVTGVHGITNVGPYTITIAANTSLSGTNTGDNAANSTYTIGTNTQAYSAKLTDIAALTATDSNIIVGNGTTWVAESGATARTSLGLAIGTDVQAYNSNLTAINQALTTTSSPSFTTVTANLTGNASGTAATVTGATQASITSAANLVTVGTITSGIWNAGAVTSSGAITATAGVTVGGGIGRASGAMQISTAAFDGTSPILTLYQAASNTGILINFGYGGSGEKFTLNTYNGASWADRFVVDRTGAATFAAGVSASGIVSTTTGDQASARFRVSNTSGHAWDLIAGIHAVSQDGFSIYDSTTGATRLTISHDGNVGIGTTSPTTKTEIYRLEAANRTTYTDILTISAGASTNPYKGHGGGILFCATNYDDGSGVLTNSARVGSTITNTSGDHTGAGLFIDVTPLDNGTLARAVSISYDGRINAGTNIAAEATYSKPLKGGIRLLSNATAQTAGNSDGYVYLLTTPTSTSSDNTTVPSTNQFVGYFAALDTDANRYGADYALWGFNSVVTCNHDYAAHIFGAEFDIQPWGGTVVTSWHPFKSHNAINSESAGYHYANGCACVVGSNERHSTAAFASYVGQATSQAAADNASWLYGYWAGGVSYASFIADLRGSPNYEVQPSYFLLANVTPTVALICSWAAGENKITAPTRSSYFSINCTNSSDANKAFVFDADGNLTVPALAGAGTRALYVTSTGKLTV
jgi:hypothetical protein